ncbi:MAG: hypothetical protein JW838_16115 [Spirochaetes bacterium]|nr:hypothetical protein [Spirochaetota bacterium]
MKSIIDFIIDASQDPGLADAFLAKVKTLNLETLQTFFKDKKYNVSDDECIRIIENSNKFPNTPNIRNY